MEKVEIFPFGETPIINYFYRCAVLDSEAVRPSLPMKHALIFNGERIVEGVFRGARLDLKKEP